MTIKELYEKHMETEIELKAYLQSFCDWIDKLSEKLETDEDRYYYKYYINCGEKVTQWCIEGGLLRIKLEYVGWEGDDTSTTLKVPIRWVELFKAGELEELEDLVMISSYWEKSKSLKKEKEEIKTRATELGLKIVEES